MPEGTVNIEDDRAMFAISPETEAVMFAGSSSIGGPFAVVGDRSSATEVAFLSE
jgi:hypothetical protein